MLEEFTFSFKMLLLLALTSHIFFSSDIFNTWMFFPSQSSRIPGLYEKLVLFKGSVFLDFLNMKKRLQNKVSALYRLKRQLINILTSLAVLGNVTHTVLQLEVSKAEWRGCSLHPQRAK